LLDFKDKGLSVRQQCNLLWLNRSGLYYQPKPQDERERKLKNLIDEQYTFMPFYGVPRMTAHLKRLGYAVGDLKTFFFILYKKNDQPVAQETRVDFHQRTMDIFFTIRLTPDSLHEPPCADSHAVGGVGELKTPLYPISAIRLTATAFQNTRLVYLDQQTG